MTDYTTERYHKYNGKKWLILQDGEKIIIAKRAALLRLTDDMYTLLYDSEGKTKEVSYNISDIDVIFIKK